MSEQLVLSLRDGGPVLVRPIEPDDKGRLACGLELLSPRSRYLRFHAPVRSFTEDQLRYLTEVDGHDHVAWVALDPEGGPDDPGMGVGRYVRLADEPEVAEAAITVLDRYQGRGVATLLLGLLGRSAIGNGVTRFRNYVLSDNQPMLDLLDGLGAVRTSEGGGVYRVDVPLPTDPDQLPDTTAGRVLRAVARGELPLFPFPRDASLPRP